MPERTVILTQRKQIMPYYPERKPEPSGGEQKQPRPAEKRGKLIRLGLLVFSCALVLFGAVKLIGYGADLVSSRNTSRELQRLHEAGETAAPAPEQAIPETPVASETKASESKAPETTVSATGAPEMPVPETGSLQPVPYPDNPGLKVSARFRELRKKSGYIMGWLSMDGLEEAVALKDNTFFLTHDAMGKKNRNGALFLDAGTYLLTRPYTLFVYGHNMKSGSMFGRLKKYKDSAYCFSHRIITFDSLYEEGKYAVFAVAEINTVPGTGSWFDLWALDTDSRAEREKAIRALEGRSVHGSILDVQADDQLLLLITCLDGEDERLVVAARRLRENETETGLTLRGV